MTLTFNGSNCTPDIDTLAFREALKYYKFLNPQHSGTDFIDLPRTAQDSVLADSQVRKMNLR